MIALCLPSLPESGARYAQDDAWVLPSRRASPGGNLCRLFMVLSAYAYVSIPTCRGVNDGCVKPVKSAARIFRWSAARYVRALSGHLDGRWCRDFLGGRGGAALAGGALGLLLGSKKGRKMGGKALKYGGVAALGHDGLQGLRQLAGELGSGRGTDCRASANCRQSQRASPGAALDGGC